jgi:predicted phosphoribosyltransferase
MAVISRYFVDRADAGCQLAAVLQEYKGAPDAIVLGLPRGGVPVAAQVADALELPLDVLCVRKLGVPFQRELAMGAIAVVAQRTRPSSQTGPLPPRHSSVYSNRNAVSSHVASGPIAATTLLH